MVAAGLFIFGHDIKACEGTLFAIRRDQSNGSATLMRGKSLTCRQVPLQSTVYDRGRAETIRSRQVKDLPHISVTDRYEADTLCWSFS